MSNDEKTNSPQESEIIIQKLPSDMGTHRNGRKGTLNAPDKILEDFESSRKVMVDEVFPDEFDLEETQKRIEENTWELAGYGKPLISLGGDHSVSYPVIKVLKNKNPGMKVVWLDAHLDLKEKIEAHVSHDVVLRELLNKNFSEDEIYIVGYTRVDEDEEDFVDKSDLNIYSHGETEEFKREFDPGEQPVYLSVDIDVLKGKLAPGTGYPDGELGMEEIEELIKFIDPDHADLVEVAPPLDEKGETMNSARIILQTLLKETG